jgi:hypothetical protein
MLGKRWYDLADEGRYWTKLRDSWMRRVRVGKSVFISAYRYPDRMLAGGAASAHNATIHEGERLQSAYRCDNLEPNVSVGGDVYLEGAGAATPLIFGRRYHFGVIVAPMKDKCRFGAIADSAVTGAEAFVIEPVTLRPVAIATPGRAVSIR